MKTHSESQVKTILVVDDDEVIREFIKTELERGGYNVIESKDGAESIRKFAECKDSIQLLILDIILPKIQGKEVYETIKKIRSDIKAIFITGYDEEYIYKRRLLEEGSELIVKSQIPKLLLGKVRELLET
jgi:CheY-like chemotaxis protein